MRDLARAQALVLAAGASDQQISAFRVEGEPIAKARARVTRYRHYTPQRTLDAEQDIADAVLRTPPVLFTGNVAVAAIFYRSNRHRIDTDNLLKTVLDGITRSKAVWPDDSHVTALIGITEYDPEWPRLVVAIAHHTSSLARGTDALTHTCETCGARYRPHAGSEDRSRYCSRACVPVADHRCRSCGGRTSAKGVVHCRACHLRLKRLGQAQLL